MSQACHRVDDGDGSIEWEYAQEPQGRRVYGVRIEWQVKEARP